ncbi:hypothetical protein [Halorussus halophilus]|uniref:hypothetical protein n=1 Tax=Halorussus halophilus TaxID=2650975 RepID=UPI00178812E0|nr:hypothetical protein [Halorussus halophilus]
MNLRSKIVSKPGAALLALVAVGALYARRGTDTSEEPEPESYETEPEVAGEH